MADRDLYELIEGAESGLLGEGDSWRQVGMRWRPCPEGYEPRPALMQTVQQVYVEPPPLVSLVNRCMEAIWRNVRYRA